MNVQRKTGFWCLCLLAGLGACCTKMDCSYVRNPGITVVYKNFIPGAREPVNVYALNKRNGSPVDSIHLTDYFSGTVRLNEGLFGELEPGGFKEYDYVLTVGTTAKDTIRDIAYEAYSYEVECNKCLLADGSSSVYDYKGLQYRHAGRLYEDADSLVIEK
ncbi:MAG TPA: hypothetical protein VF646_05375 [Cytophagales bacterium]